MNDGLTVTITKASARATSLPKAPTTLHEMCFYRLSSCPFKLRLMPPLLFITVAKNCWFKISEVFFLIFVFKDFPLPQLL